MKLRLLIAFLPFLFWYCSQKPEQRTTKNSNNQPITYADSGISSFRFTKKDTIHGQYFRMAETTYKVVNADLSDKDSQHYLVKFHTITDAGTGMEGQNRTIQFFLSPLENPSNTILTAKHECDELTFDWHHYQTIKYGCCGSFNQLKFYDYHAKLLVEGYDEIITASVPNKNFRFYMAFQPEEGKDTTTLGTLQLSYSSSEIYRIKIKSLQPSSNDYYPMGVLPTLTLRSSSHKDTYDKDQKEYSLWSLEHSTLPWPQQVNGFTIRANFDLDPKLGLIDIPIINGRPFGKEDKNQVYWLKGKSRQ
ncbi:hypothetical protein EXU85_24195 [Spirosoma sp. KCTC 42546]|uniref:hypothetical protein n=1 Tax=Spirosoma sp. KCTC 42546 TaxID=2520506 RepID=UPI00115ADBDC|nr:hypothetical protein [Spirosoma sp. KCTC 42546]QDK81539.1 hypothetical protein EXU85_24195 [Spirosoma sp. KCTC 42546]